MSLGTESTLKAGEPSKSLTVTTSWVTQPIRAAHKEMIGTHVLLDTHDSQLKPPMKYFGGLHIKCTTYIHNYTNQV